MKKIFVFIIVLICFTLIGCNNSTNEGQEENKFETLEDYIKEINVPTEVSESFYLPATVNDFGNHDIYWTSNNKDAIKISNSNIVEIEGLLYYKATVTQAAVDKIVTLKMSIEVVGLGSMDKNYDVTVLKIDLSTSDTISFTFFALNDFHGTVFDEDGGLSKIGNYIINEKSKSPDTTVVISSGDMFQGSAISNMTEGGVVVEAMNEIGFDSMTIGNHEFDWGTEVLEKYYSKTSNVVPNFPFLGCNIYDKKTNKPVTWCDPYTIIEKVGIKIGIIGAIGSELESSIATSIVSPYEFKDPIPFVKQYAKELRNEKGCELVILSIHDNTLNINQAIADLTGEYQIDAVFNGHTHSTYAGETKGSDNLLLPYVQSGSYGSAIGKIVIEYNKVDKVITEVGAENILVSRNISTNNTKLDSIISKHNESIAEISEEVIGISGESMDKPSLGRWGANVIKDYSNSDIGFINGGGIRNSDIEMNQEVTVGKMWEIMPFDNFVKTCTMTSKDIIRAYYGSDIIHSSNVEVINGVLYVDGQACNDDQTFKVAAVDYIFDKTEMPFLNGTNQATTGQLFRDYLIQAVRDACKDGDKWFV